MPPEEQVLEILSRVKALSTEQKRWLTDDEFRKIYSDVTGTNV
jgi:isopropylmalate/homocitrate/citramalate synthase